MQGNAVRAESPSLPPSGPGDEAVRGLRVPRLGVRLPETAAALAPRSWSRLHGLVSLESYGHLQHQTLSPEKLFHEELARLIRSSDIMPKDR
ncbi:TetR-like C-terminal domain-containing protein [Streptomyces sp. NPDC004539]|uniref:TetR-like C-terminal domain-containing protein n=1 Tax=Streptomyces sp. NPDC004539 TaxID=3154280 RepID=UPI0033AF2E1C